MALYEPIHYRFAKYCEAKVGDVVLAEDLINDSLLVAFENFEKIKNKNALIFFLFGTAHRIFLNQLRKKKPLFDDNIIAIDNSSQPDELLEIKMLYKSISKLDEKYSEVILLKEISGFSIKEISIMKELSQSAVKVRLHRAKQKLKVMLEDKLTAYGR